MRFRLCVKTVFGKSRTLIEESAGRVAELAMLSRRDRLAASGSGGRIVREPDRCDLGLVFTRALRISNLASKNVTDRLSLQ